jgi:hypothetical protein
MKVIVVLNWIGVMVGCIAGALVGVTGMATASSAPQEAVVVCLALACAVIPYCWARAWTEIYRVDSYAPAVSKTSGEPAYQHTTLGL